MSERKDLVTLGKTDTSWNDLPSSERIHLRSVEWAFVALQHCKLFRMATVGRGVNADQFLSGVTTLDVLANKVDELFGGLTKKGREKLGRHILNFVGRGPQPADLNGNGDTFSVKEALMDWVRTDFGVEITASKE